MRQRVNREDRLEQNYVGAEDKGHETEKCSVDRKTKTKGTIGKNLT